MATTTIKEFANHARRALRSLPDSADTITLLDDVKAVEEELTKSGVPLAKASDITDMMRVTVRRLEEDYAALTSGLARLVGCLDEADAAKRMFRLDA